jgi:hypothetical protein
MLEASVPCVRGYLKERGASFSDLVAAKRQRRLTETVASERPSVQAGTDRDATRLGPGQGG